MTELIVRDLRPEFGSEVIGLDPSIPLDPQTRQKLQALFDTRGILVFRDFGAADIKVQTYISEILGGGAVDPDDLSIFEMLVSNREERGGAPFGRLLFHSDMMWIESGCTVLSLFGQTIAQPAIPTLFVSAAHGWASLPADLRARVEGLSAVTCQDATAQRGGSIPDDVLVSTFEEEVLLTLPIGYSHPRTGETLLYICPQMTHHIEGLDHEESEALLEALFDHYYAPDQILEHHWREGDLVVWDNIALQHARPNVSMQGPARTLRKVMIPNPTKFATGLATYSKVGD
ncbi:taurine dioxygenase [Novosphingobium sp. CF614]|uniref:TauD/TfdA dioxygenase family protein n=1 Tax=Novosphingobium sp. CF614 TaxID=1884364 RepID=UPI0008EDC615|nr:TauD/TfdA family dioxygenase [Novosphingobium sp. CF614]SFF82894.1 taurine dioxygenase [Novosphingobium sp. CF614]